jgi:putative ABC transport system permease protein
MNIRNSIIKGALPTKQGEALISDEFSERFNVKIGDEVTLFSSTMNNSMSFTNFVVCGTVQFGMSLLDRGSIIIDIKDAQMAFDMEDATSEMLGYIKESKYDDEVAGATKDSFNKKYSNPNDEFSPVMMKLKDQNGLKEYIEMADSMSGIMVFIFIMAMSVVLWNTGLLGGLRRYNEYGIRLALGEEKSHIYKTMIYEAILIGIIGTVIGTIFGLSFSFYLQEHGLDFSALLKNTTMMFPSRFRAMVKPDMFYIGFFPGLIATVIGNALAGVGIYKRKTAQLFKELEV